MGWLVSRTGPALISNLANAYIDEAVGLIDHYVDRVISKTKSSIGQCGPISASFNATVHAVLRKFVDNFLASEIILFLSTNPSRDKIQNKISKCLPVNDNNNDIPTFQQ